MRKTQGIKQPWQLDLETRYTNTEAQAVADAQIATHAADADTHHISAVDIDTDVQTLLPASSITAAFFAPYVIVASTSGETRTGVASLKPEESEIIFNDGTNTCTLAATATGTLTVVAAGTETFTLKLAPIWI